MHIPTSTYRIQFTPSFTFNDAKNIIPYLSLLGVSDLYASPIFQSVEGSCHGYDIVDPNTINHELGGAEAFNDILSEIKQFKMFWLQDIVPNHMAFNKKNHMLMDVLENGERSPYFNFFDIEWKHIQSQTKNRLLAPFLGKFYGECLDDGDIKLCFNENGFSVKYYDLNFPLKIESYQPILTRRLSMLEQKLGEQHPDFSKFIGTSYTFSTPKAETDHIEHLKQIKFTKEMLWDLYNNNQEIKKYIDDTIADINGQPGSSETFTMLDNILSDQYFRLSFWKVATEELNYRRFFNINQLISLRVERDEVFNHTHDLIFKLVNNNQISGLRVDHIDGLFDPTDYLKKLKQKTNHTYIIVEKILDFKEKLPAVWQTEGTTGYNFLNIVNSLFCDRKNQRKFNRIYSKFTKQKINYDDLLSEKKRLIIGKHMAGDIDNLAQLIKSMSGIDRFGTDITLYGLKRALVEIMTFFPVYRTYINKSQFSSSDKKYMQEAINRAKQKNPALAYELNFIEKLLLMKLTAALTTEDKALLINFIMRLQQFTGPLMAKGVEDTFLYNYNRLISLNDVGGNPGKFGISINEFHYFNIKRTKSELNSSSTHDTKRGEDVRARINVLSEIPYEWENKIKTWKKLNKPLKNIVNRIKVPDYNDEYFLYQTLIGAWPFDKKEHEQFISRIKEYIIKAVREAKVHTAWLKPDADYENVYLSFIEKVLNPSDNNEFLKDFLPFQKKVAHFGMLNSISQTLLKITSTGIPDIYQGSELWDLNLVDPDNRRKVDFEKRYNLIKDIDKQSAGNQSKLIEDLLKNPENGAIKLFLIYKALNIRKTCEALSIKGKYIPLEISGEKREHVVAYARELNNQWAITVAPRLLTSLINEGEFPIGKEIWKDTQLLLPIDTHFKWKNIFTNQHVEIIEKISIGDILTSFPVSLLLSIGKED